ncbi:MAG: hypothetical protein FRX49_13383 [Trebouxia sp. A1-2]|nr:MAG: hypothetical protein FRX49_13383 [Trebouxia sp. A1-2]
MGANRLEWEQTGKRGENRREQEQIGRSGTSVCSDNADFQAAMTPGKRVKGQSERQTGEAGRLCLSLCQLLLEALDFHPPCLGLRLTVCYLYLSLPQLPRSFRDATPPPSPQPAPCLKKKGRSTDLIPSPRGQTAAALSAEPECLGAPPASVLERTYLLKGRLRGKAGLEGLQLLMQASDFSTGPERVAQAAEEDEQRNTSLWRVHYLVMLSSSLKLSVMISPELTQHSCVLIRQLLQLSRYFHGVPPQAAGWTETVHQTQTSAVQKTAVQNTAKPTAVFVRIVIALPASCRQPEPPDATRHDLCQALKLQTQQGLGLAGQSVLQPVHCLQLPMQPLDPI